MIEEDISELKKEVEIIKEAIVCLVQDKIEYSIVEYGYNVKFVGTKEECEKLLEGKTIKKGYSYYYVDGPLKDCQDYNCTIQRKIRGTKIHL